MPKLFILGNGFDIASGLNTRYSDFRKWFINNHQLNYAQLDRIVREMAFSELDIPESIIGHHGEVIYDDECLAKFFYVIVTFSNKNDITWRNFESNLANLPFYEFEDSYYYDGDDEYEEADIVEQTGTNLASVFVDAVNKYFNEWIYFVHKQEQPKNKKKLICNNCDSSFLIFNYTDVLENFYKISNEKICHIHGYVREGDQLVIGHGSKVYYNDDFDPLNVNSYMVEAEETLRKPVNDIITNNISFFNQLGTLTEIFIIGLGLDDPNFVDAPYLQEVFKHTDINSILYFDEFDKGKINVYMNTCSQNGFEGKYGISNSITNKLSII